MSDHPLRSAIQGVVCERDCNVYLYAGTINRQTCDGIINDILDAPKPREPLSKTGLSGFQAAGRRQGPEVGPESAAAAESGVSQAL